jgi:hypothetical protein
MVDAAIDARRSSHAPVPDAACRGTLNYRATRAPIIV